VFLAEIEGAENLGILMAMLMEIHTQGGSKKSFKWLAIIHLSPRSSIPFSSFYKFNVSYYLLQGA